MAMLVGAGALNAQDEVLEIAELLGAGIAKSWLGKAVNLRRRFPSAPATSACSAPSRAGT